ncbi:alpha/beta fold hydrolase [Labrys monachus]|uniref:Pimeloyl-ACP methyl ester carboxylesterase n=1 Tax=Labrys monachus TaxID=217067 RepID=A0ABU0F8N0_9HYPH|nr:alpha/beta fold hydrolase [Labrys monachus]MDQ0390970.1 pimeloyl-ACP methyl ester carboxylesterase [Labrys monachus]
MASIAGGAIVADVRGDGFPVVMVHGLGGTSNTYQPQMAVLANYRVVRPDLPGSGRSPVPFERLSIEWLAEAVISGLDSLGIRRAHVVGHSLGTLVCQRIAAETPDRVASLTLFGALTAPPDAARNGLIERAKKARSEGMEAIADQIIANTLSPSTHAEKPEAVAFVRESVMRQPAEGYAKTCEALSAAQPAEWSRIKAPTLLVTGDADPVAPVSMAQILSERIAGARLCVVERCGHWVTIERAQESNRRLAAFLQQHGS